jgi:2-polyprenyl-3-methyl-5-hydroxy-6-metoxy-1,4-benzoquinol methylase
MTDALAAQTYFEVIADLRASDFAKRRKLSIQPMPAHLEEVEMVRKYLPAGGTFLDIGTGIGVVPEVMLRLGHKVITIDVALKESQREPLQRLMDLGAEGHFAMVGMDPVPVADSSVDVVFAGDVIEHLPNTPKWCLAEIARLLKPGGHALLTTPNAVRLATRLKVFAGHSNWPPVTDYIDNSRDFRHHMGHHKEYTARELEYVLGHAGFADIKVDFVEDTLKRRGVFRSLRDIKTQDRNFDAYWGGRAKHWLNPFELLRLLLVLTVRIVPPFRSTLFAVARKPTA